MRKTALFPIDDPDFWKKQLLHWAAGHELAVYLDSNRSDRHSDREAPSQAVTSSHRLTTDEWECLAAAGSLATLETSAGQAFTQLGALLEEQDWLFGFFGYDLKNETERLFSENTDGIGLTDLGFFRPETVAGIRAEGKGQETRGKEQEVKWWLEIQALDRSPESVWEEIRTWKGPEAKIAPAGIELQPRIPKPEYLEKVEAIRSHIVEGDLYEMNLCQEFFAENAGLDPVAVFERLNTIGQAPFSAFLRWHDRYLLSASPERFLKKEGRRVISQPIKGTRKRSGSRQDDHNLRLDLASSEKDRAENVMIVDLVRNDLARNCQPGSVRVDELFGIYTFETVHQMISTISGTLREAEAIKGNSGNYTNYFHYSNGLTALRDAFPPGSMTGAPKVMAMELIERYEETRRGLYSGALGYFDPAGDFDFNVVIRSILYNAACRYVSVQVGGAIVFDSVPEQEYEECLVKAAAMIKALQG